MDYKFVLFLINLKKKKLRNTGYFPENWYKDKAKKLGLNPSFLI
ncbi:hypothetical protein HMPREF9383_0201 [Streptococcus sanguinis SK150]|uniref:Uncharacterized protein n=1 Tax=Streptococcus sanguinis SK150 TaxID=888811 RepID=F0IJ99_STRSA|nr:hypothetical protein HMPREF9383_0201 [Streptococcus sanguinis SK150]